MGCNQDSEHTVVYEFTMFRNGNISMWPDTISQEFLDGLTRSHYSLQDDMGKLVTEGDFLNGYKVGDWSYYPDTVSTIQVNWSLYSKPNDSTKINYPTSWTTSEDATRPFQASFPVKQGENSIGKHFIIQAHNRDSIDMDLAVYQEYYKSTMFESETVNEYAHFVLELHSGSVLYFLRYVIKRNGEDLLILVLLGNSGSEICDATYSSASEDQEEKHIIFFDMMRSFELHGKPFFSPLDPVKTFKRTEYSNVPQSPTS